MMKREEKSDTLRQTACFGVEEDEKQSSKDSLDETGELKPGESHDYSFGD